MIRLSMILAAIFFLGCSSKNETVKTTGRYLYFTSKFPSGVFWQVVTDFKSTTDENKCKSTSPITGELVPSNEKEFHYLRISGDTIKVPLFWGKKSPCEWALTDVALQHDGERCMGIHAIVLVDDKGASGVFGDRKSVPDILNFTCKLDSASGCFRCKESNGAVNTGFRMPVMPAYTFSVNLNF